MLVIRSVDLSFRFLIEPVLSYVTSHANDGEPRWRLAVGTRSAGPTQANTFADGILIGPPAAGEGLVHDCDWQVRVIVRVSKRATAQQWDLHGLQIGRADIVNVSVGEL